MRPAVREEVKEAQIPSIEQAEQLIREE